MKGASCQRTPEIVRGRCRNARGQRDASAEMQIGMMITCHLLDMIAMAMLWPYNPEAYGHVIAIPYHGQVGVFPL